MKQFVQDFFRQEYAGGVVLFLAAVLAMAFANSPANSLYNALLGTLVEVRIGEFLISKPLLLWINDGLMAIFFFQIGLELKREAIAGRLADRSKILLPMIAAIGGMVVPVLIYFAVNHDNSVAMRGWAIPSATDIAFALGVLALLGKRIPDGLKLFLLTLAVLDDLGAILIIAVFYTSTLSSLSLTVAAMALLGLFTLNRCRVLSIAPYCLIGVVLWAAVLKSGIHATLAGVILALFIPFRKPQGQSLTRVEEMEKDLTPAVMFVILPLFAFANSGVTLTGLSVNSLTSPVPFGIVAGLFFGKQLGIFGFSYTAVKLGLGRLPSDINWRLLYGAAMLCGIGFTMSLLISTLAFQQGNPVNNMINDRIGIIAGSLLSGICGYLWLLITCKKME